MAAKKKRAAQRARLGEEHPLTKGGVSFSTIMAVFGAILIALGVAWLVAQNWHQMPSALKIILLLFFTALAFTAGILFRTHDYEGIGKSLLVLGSLLYTLSIFLIAQIFSTSTSFQGQAWLWLLALAGVIAVSLLFESSASFVVALMEFFIWVIIQGIGFAENIFSGSEAGIILIPYFTGAGIATALVAAAALFLYFRDSKRTMAFANLAGGLLSSTVIFWVALFIFPLFDLTLKGAIQGAAWVLLLTIAVLAAWAYLRQSGASLFVAFIELVQWVTVQFFAFSDFEEGLFVSPGIYALLLLALGALFYGLSLWHRDWLFGTLYQWWTAFFFLLLTYVLSFQLLLPAMWPDEASVTTASIVFLFFLVLAALAVLVSGAVYAVERRLVESRDILGMLAIIVLLAVLIGSTSLVSGSIERVGYYFGDIGAIPLDLWVVWSVINIVFVLVILAVSGYGTWKEFPAMINLGIVFFGLDVITRYIGFIIDLYAYTGLAFVFITGGIVLLAGGWGIERWRRKLIAEAR